MMSADQPIRLAKRSKYLRSNIIRDMLRVANQPGMIALGGGNPANESFPVALMPQLMADVMRNHAAVALQYCDTQGYPPLREALASWLAGQGIPATMDNIIITTGSHRQRQPGNWRTAHLSWCAPGLFPVRAQMAFPR
jgi:2-aminoadipate transaminase